MRRLARFVQHRRWLVLVATLVFLPIAVVLSAPVADQLSAGLQEDPGAESVQANRLLTQQFSGGEPNLVLLVRVRGASLDDPEVAANGRRLTTELASRAGVAFASSYWSTGGAPQLRSRDGRSALILVRLLGDEDTTSALAADLSERYSRDDARYLITVGGVSETARQLTEQAEKDLAKAERISGPVTLVALLAVFGSLVAALLPLAVGALAVLGTLLVLASIALLTDVSIFALNLTTALGLGLAIDYSLFVVSRYREELAGGRNVAVSVVRTMQTAGRTVIFSAAVVSASLAALLVFPIPYLRSFAYAGIAVVLFAAASAVIVLPALLAALGENIDRGAVFRRRSGRTGSFWHDQANRVMRHPSLYALAVIAVLLVLGLPFLHTRLGLTDDRVLPASLSSRATGDAVRADFATREASSLNVVVLGSVPSSELDGYASALSRLDDVARVDALSGYYQDGMKLPPDALSERFRGDGGSWLIVVPEVAPLSPAAEDLVRAVRAQSAPHAEVLVAGPSARLVDSKQAVLSRLPLALVLIATTTFLLLFLMTGSVLVPVKALLVNTLSLTATFGAMVWIFQDGHLSGLLDFTPTGSIDVFTPILMFCIAFGLSMDYEVFLLSRIKEEYDLHGDNEAAVAVGLARTGAIVTAAALLLAIVFAAFATSQIALVKLFGVGLTLAVLVDAFLIRATLVPAFMKLAGPANWWAPRALRRFHLRYGLWETEPVELLDHDLSHGTESASRPWRR